MNEQFLEVGQITNIHGIMGEVRVHPWADSPDFLCQFKTLYVGASQWPIKVLNSRPHKNMCVMKLEGVTDVNSAMAMRGSVLYIDRKDANLPKGTFFLVDIEGLDVLDNETGENLGKIAEVMTMPASNVYLVKGGARELMIPAVDAFIAETNVEAGYIKVNLIEGL